MVTIWFLVPSFVCLRPWALARTWKMGRASQVDSLSHGHPGSGEFLRWAVIHTCHTLLQGTSGTFWETLPVEGNCGLVCFLLGLPLHISFSSSFHPYPFAMTNHVHEHTALSFESDSWVWEYKGHSGVLMCRPKFYEYLAGLAQVAPTFNYHATNALLDCLCHL